MTFPLEPISMLAGTLVGVWQKVQQQKNENEKIRLLGVKQYLADIQSAREHSKGNKELQWTKRVLALMFAGTYCLLHLGVNVPELLHLTTQTHIGYTEIVPKFLFFGEKEAIKWISVAGGTITPALSNVVCGLVGYYFGSGGSRRGQ